LAGGKFEKRAIVWIPKLALDDEAPIVLHGHDQHGARMHDVFAHRFTAIGQPCAIAAHVEQCTRVDLLAADALLGERVVLTATRRPRIIGRISHASQSRTGRKSAYSAASGVPASGVHS